MIKRAQLVGYENRQLKKQIEQKDTGIAALKGQLDLTQKTLQSTQEQLNQATALVKQTTDENKRLEEEVRQKNARITGLTQTVDVMQEKNMQSQQMIFITQLTESLVECRQKLAKYEPAVDANAPAEPNQ
jgi:predicted  nucleic acid-binding Zn-ribbon protein